MTKRTLKSELLMPAGNLEKLKTAVLYGADAIYMGTPDLSLRVKSEMSLEDVVEGIEFAHKNGKRVYLTLNLFSHNKDIERLPEYVETIRSVKPDGLIIADPGVFMFVKDMAPELELHVSTQANVCSWQSVKFWQDQGAALCVLGREVNFSELTEIREKCPDIKLEAFVHGSMCMTYSGRCLLSNFLSERGANQGSCTNSCRWKYKVHMKLRDGTVRELELTEENLEMFDFFLEEDHRPGELMPIIEDERGSYILNSRDLCLMPKLDDYLELGVDSLKVEGRGKSPYYVALVARAYRLAMDDWAQDLAGWNSEDYLKELSTVPNRGYTLAFHEGRLTNYAHGYEDTATIADYEYGGVIVGVEEDALIMEVKNRLVAGDVLDFIPPKRRETMLLRIYEFTNAETGERAEAVNGTGKPRIRLPFSLFQLEDIQSLKTDFPIGTIVRKERALSEAQWARIKQDNEASKLELEKGSKEKYLTSGEQTRTLIDEGANTRRLKTPRQGLEGCCGKACNGCLMFWHDPLYEKARMKYEEGRRLRKPAE